jgi:hypothetical protein
MACRGGSQKACTEADRIRARVTQSTHATGTAVPTQPASGSGPGTSKPSDSLKR